MSHIEVSLLIVVTGIVFMSFWYNLAKYFKWDKVEFVFPSELSDPKVNLKPLLLHTTHYEVLEVFQRLDRELYGSQLDYYTGKPSADKRAWELAKLGYLDRKKEPFIAPSGRKVYRNLYKINDSWRLLLKTNW